jgi:glycosyltransferase involved in cell wall biosynthesis
MCHGRGGATVKVLYVHHTELTGGAAQSLLCLLRHLGGTNIQPTLLAPATDSVDVPGVRRVHTAPAQFRWSLNPLRLLAARGDMLRLARDVRHVARDCDAELIHANTWPAALAAVSAGAAPVIWHVRDVRIRPLVTGWLQGHCAAQIAISRTVEAFLGQRGFAPEGIRLVYNGIDAEEFKPQRTRDEVRTELNLPPDAPVIVSVADMIPWKRHDLLLFAAGQIHKALPEVRFLFVGVRWCEQAGIAALLTANARPLGLSGHIDFLDYRKDVADLLGAADLFWHAAPDEPFGRAVLEAMTLGLPVVVPASGGTAELVEHEKSGLCVKPESAEALAEGALRVLRDRTLARSLGAGAWARAVSHFSAAQMVQGTLAVYEQVAGRGVA